MGDAANSFNIAIKLNLTANTIVILSATPLLAAILSRMFLKEHIPGRTWLAIFACTGGVAVVSSGSWEKVACSVIISLLNVLLAPLSVWLTCSEKPSKATLVGGVIIVLTLSLHSVMGTNTRIIMD